MRKLLPELRTREAHYLLTHLHGSDADKQGSFTFNELLVRGCVLNTCMLGAHRRGQVQDSHRLVDLLFTINFGFLSVGKTGDDEMAGHW